MSMFKTVISKHDNPAGDFNDNEVRGMNDDRKAEQRFWDDEHNH